MSSLSLPLQSCLVTSTTTSDAVLTAHNHLTLLIGPGARNSFLKDVRHRFSVLDLHHPLHPSNSQCKQNIRQLDYLTSLTAAGLAHQFPRVEHLTLAAYDVDVSTVNLFRCLILSWSSTLKSLRFYIRLGSNTDYFPQAWANSSRLLKLLDTLNFLKKLQHLTIVFHHQIFSTNVNAAEILNLSDFFFSSVQLQEFNFSTLDDVQWTPVIDWLLQSEYHQNESGNLQRIAIGNPDEHFTVFNRLLKYPKLARKIVELPNLGCRAGGEDYFDAILSGSGAFLEEFSENSE